MDLEVIIIMDWKENQLMDTKSKLFPFVMIGQQKLTFTVHIISVDAELGQNYYPWQDSLKKKKKATDWVDEQDQGDYRILFGRATGYY